MPITAKILETAKSDPERPALVEGDRTVTYAEIAQSGAIYDSLNAAVKSNRLAAAASNFTNSLRVAVCLSSALEAAYLVASLAGFDVVTLVLDPKWPLEHRANAAEQGGMQVVVTDDEVFAVAIAESLKIPVLSFSEIATNAKSLSEPKVRGSNEPFLLIFTSGTTDLPKGFYRTRNSWRYNVEISKRYLFAESGIKTIAPGPISYSLTLYALIETLATGGTLHLQSEFNVRACYRSIVEEEIPRLVCVPAILTALTEYADTVGLHLNELKYAVVGGAALNPKTRNQFEKVAPNAKLLSYYGAAEIGFIGYSMGSEMLTPFEGVELSIRKYDATGEPKTPAAELETGELGSLYVRVPSQADRYVTVEAPGGLVTQADGWATVHDQAYKQSDGFVLMGRSGEIANTGGHKVSLMQVDAALENATGHPAVAVAIKHEKLGEKVVAVVESSDPLTKKEILQRLREILPPQFVPQQLYRAEKLPRTAGGKIRREETRQWLQQGKYQRLI